jgi:hypothetical protein
MTSCLPGLSFLLVTGAETPFILLDSTFFDKVNQIQGQGQSGGKTN